jgi:hypothetical protein
MPGGTDNTLRAEPNPAWVAFFAEAMRLAELARQRRAARETERGNEERQDKESDNVPTGANMTTGKCP